MMTLTISIQSDWINPARQRELEKNLANDPLIGDFVFNQSGDLEVFLTEDEPAFGTMQLVYNLCFLKIQTAVHLSTIDLI